MKAKAYERLLRKMFIVECLGEHLYRTLYRKCKDRDQKSIYQKLAENETATKDCIAQELAHLQLSAPIHRARLVSGPARLFFQSMSLKCLHGFLVRILRRRMYSSWHAVYRNRNEAFWMQLLEHEHLQYELLELK